MFWSYCIILAMDFFAIINNIQLYYLFFFSIVSQMQLR